MARCGRRNHFCWNITKENAPNGWLTRFMLSALDGSEKQKVVICNRNGGDLVVK